MLVENEQLPVLAIA